MSFSSSASGAESRPALHELYGECSSCSGSDTVDSFVIRDIHEKRERVRKGEPLTEENFFASLVANLRSCCAPSSRKSRAAVVGGAPGASAAAAAVRAAHSAAAAAAQSPAQLLMQQQRKKTFTSGESSSSSRSRSETGAALREVDGSVAAPQRSLNKLVAWRVTADVSNFNEVLTAAQASWAALVWTVRLEFSERMTARMLLELLEGAAQQKRDVDVLVALSKTPQFQAVALSRRLSGRVLEDIFGDFAAALEQQQHQLGGGGETEEERRNGKSGAETAAVAGNALYMVICRFRVLGMYCRRQGEFLDVSVFDPLPSEEDVFPPSFIGFKNVQDMLEYVKNIFSNDPREKRGEGEAIQGFILTSKHTFAASPYTRDYTAKRPAGRDDWMAQEELKKKDALFDAKVMYTNMYRATDARVENENIFSMDPGTGMQIHDPKHLEAQEKFLEDEGDD